MKPVNWTGNYLRWSERPDDDCIAALMYLYDIQMLAEQCKGVNNKLVGFTGLDTPFMCAVAERINTNKPITERQLSVMKYKLNSYWKQLKDADISKYFTQWQIVRYDTQDIDAPAWKKCKVVGQDLKLTFSYDESLINRIKLISGRQYHNTPTEKYWTVPINKQAIKQLINLGFDIPKKLLNDLTPQQMDFDYSGLLMTLRPYQVVGANRLAGELKLNGLLADEMGLGKSAQALAALWARRKTAFPALIVCPGSLKYNWAREAEMWLPDIQVRVLEGFTDRKQYKCHDRYELTIINYDILADRSGAKQTKNGWGKLLAETGFKTAIFDECHKMKNPKAKRTAEIIGMCQNIPNRIALSGTPIESRPIEFFTTLQLVAPKLFPNYWQYGVRYCGSVQNDFGLKFNGASNTQELNEILTDNCMIRRRKTDVLKELPPKQRQVIPVQINMKEYKKAEKQMVSYLQALNGHVSGPDQMNVLATIERCKQAAVLGKMKQAVDFVEDYLESGRKLVVFATHTFTLNELEKAFSGLTTRVDGSVTGNKRQQAVDKFQNDPNCKLFLGNIKAAGVGLTLTAASDTLTLELGWTPGEHEQAEDRTHRIGQTADSVMAYYMIAQDTIEEKIMQILDDKRKVLSQVLDGREVKQNSMLMELLKQYKSRPRRANHGGNDA